ncbi:XRE family transcriptional regulator [Rhodopseudomonas sp. HC1]|uniref:S24 family peptidase n=1 Tax=Rhodopseudomonas infernalis TaxID=2897386 RepID=UPI001EE7E3C9|nr:XRE family transcriptional regulator [Rhodopseudomonas infernalis]MCG6203670.1 XRE family transcriptional regulator [Rhodopseudomonas infernalis]
MHIALMKEPFERLQQARKEAGFADAADAAEALGIPLPTYFAHENGSRGLSRSGKRYADFFKVSLDWLVGGKGPARPKQARAEPANVVPLVGYVGAGAETHFFGEDGQLDEVNAPDGSSDSTVAVEIRGDSLGTFFDRWLVFYDDVRRPVTTDLINKLCVVGLDDGRILIKKLQKSRTKGHFHLLSQTEPPIFDARIEWAAKVKHLVPR